ncbi:MAG: DUF2163 domain-containing protein [Paracoccus denitrificans]|uniref:DUF2163 domain-containing protein n=1 Tax=Paracoccus denitrificans TaxID=266 RepID=A0A533I552_PARDE|nr:MAG: DUF2163 domain-containing protein [Paracoccus denitrificans]
MTTTTIARSWSITRTDGLVLGFTDHDAVLTFAGITFRPDIGLSAQAVVQGAGLSVDNTEAVGALSDGAIEEADILAGRWDGAELCQWEVDWSDPSRHKLVFRGHLGEVCRSGGAFKAELRGLSEPLNQPVGRVFHPRCSAVLGDRMCKVDLDQPGLSATARIVAVDGGTLRLAGLPGIDDRWFERGAIQFLDGEAEAIRCHVKNDRALPDGMRQVELWTAPGVDAAQGDRVRLVAGCDKSAGMCQLKFSNYINFRGFPHLPEEDWLLAPAKERTRRAEWLFRPGNEGEIIDP